MIDVRLNNYKHAGRVRTWYTCFLLLFVFQSGFGQKIMPGDWHVTAYKGMGILADSGCTVHITKSASGFLVAHTADSNACKYNLPPAGVYAMKGTDKLVNGDEELTYGHSRLYYGALQLMNKELVAKIKIAFDAGTELLMSVDSIKDAKMQKAALEKSARKLTEALTLDDYCTECRFNRCLVWHRLKDIDKEMADAKELGAIKYRFERVDTLYSMVSEDCVRYGWEKFGKAGKYKQAAEVFNKWLTVDPASSDLWYNLGGACYSDKQYKNAVHAFRMCLSLDSTNVKAMQGLDAALSAAGQ